MSRRFINMSKRHLEKNYIIYFVLCLFIIVGIIIGSIFVLRVNESESFKLMPYLNYVFNYLGNGEYTNKNIYQSSLFFNIKFLLMFWVLGFISVGILIIPLIVSFKGISIGFTVGFFVKKFGIKGFLFSLLGFLPNYLILVPIFFIMGTVSILQSISRSDFKNNKFREINLTDYSIILLVLFVITLFSSLLEGFFISILLELINI